MWKWTWPFIVQIVIADIYLHNPRGSNNRLNEKSAARANANRLFDSQNNDRGGYNVGDLLSTPAIKEDEQYVMKYFQSGPVKSSNGDGRSLLNIEWTHQHGCGSGKDTDPHRQGCNIVIQYQCQDIDTHVDILDRLRDGLLTTTHPHTPMTATNENKESMLKRKNSNVDEKFGLHESWEAYDKCYMRERNRNLFTADQTLKIQKLGYSSAIHTRQNPNGNRRGYECPEERDYYPYWHPTRWIDIVVMAQTPTMCKYYQTKSHNVKPLHECIEKYADGTNKHWSRWNDKMNCSKNNGTWIPFTNYLEKAPDNIEKYNCEHQTKPGLKYVWGFPSGSNIEECLVALDQPDCIEAPWTRANHLGNGMDGKPLSYTWTLPFFPSRSIKKCVLRIRYNISTDDYNPNLTDAHYNDNRKKGTPSPVRQNPIVDIGEKEGLRLAINTAQYGRTFQDRSHTFLLKPRLEKFEKHKIYNLNIRGKRGNIVQVYPAVEYDFVPTELNITRNDLIHIQWTGSNTHNNGNPAGDGQAGDAGQGTAGTDRNNFVQINDRSQNYPVPFENSTLWTAIEALWIYHNKTDILPPDLAINLASSGYYWCRIKKDCPNLPDNYIYTEKTEKLNVVLNNAPASYEGVLLKIKKKGVYHYMCTRNNNFSNRSQKGTIIITD